MLKILLLTLTLFVAGCAGTIQSASLSEAYKKYELEEFERTLELITRAENVKQAPREMRAELIFLKAQTHESLGQKHIAHVLYEYLAQEHNNSQYGYLASHKLKRKS